MLCAGVGFSRTGNRVSHSKEEAQRRSSVPICTSTLSPSTHVPSFLRWFRGMGRRVTGQDVALGPGIIFSEQEGSGKGDGAGGTFLTWNCRPWYSGQVGYSQRDMAVGTSGRAGSPWECPPQAEDTLDFVSQCLVLIIFHFWLKYILSQHK